MDKKEPAKAEQEGQEGAGQEDKAEEMNVQEYHEEFPNCAICGNPESAVHHIDPKGMGGSKWKDREWNWITLCDLHHRQAHRLEHLYLSKEFLFEVKKRIEKKRKEEYVFGGQNC